MTLFVTLLLLQFTVTGQTLSSSIARAGDDVTLPCNKEIKHEDKCNGTTWLFSRSGPAEVLINLGRINNNEISKDRLGLTADCSLVIRNVTVIDFGRYTCRQYNKAGEEQGPDAAVVLYVIYMEERNSSDQVFLFCSVLRNGRCEHTVEWLYEGNDVNDVETSQLFCSARVTFKTPRLTQKSKYYELLKCNVTDRQSGNTLLCNVDPQSSCENTGNTSVEGNITPATAGWWRFIILGLATLVMIVVAVYIWKRTKGNKTQMDVNAVHREDEDEGTVTYENVGEPSASVRLH
ncbi:uncharacterized protein PEZ65_017321 isoform 2-T2 [Lycodopsis pacificus]